MQHIKYLLLLCAFLSSLSANLPPQGTISNTYDSMGRLSSQTNANAQTISYSYDGVGNITSIQTPLTSISKTYDALNRLETVTDEQGVVTYTYDAIGRQTQVNYSNGMSSRYTYDTRNRITKIEHKNSADVILQSFTYTLDAVGNRTQIVEHNGRTTNYEYNSVNQLTKETVSNDPKGNNTTTSFTYDKVGNLKTKTIDGIDTSYAYNENDQLTTQGSKTFTYDANGNLVSDTDNTYEFDDKNRLIKVTTPTDTVEYSYDANDNRIAKLTSNGTTTYLIDGNTAYAQVITESKANSTEIHYTYGNDLLSDGNHNFLTDALGSTRGLVDNAETLTDSYNYKAYGELSSHEGTSSNSFLFTGEQFDSETDEYYLRARYYSPNSGRFISRDSYDGTAGNPISQNHYLYTGSNPTNYVDLSGNNYTIASVANASAISSILGGIAQSNGVRILMGLIQKMPGIVTSGVRGLARGMSRDVATSGQGISIIRMQSILTIAKLYSRFGDHAEMDKIPIQVYGSDVLPQHQNHIFDSMIGLGSNGRPTSGILTYTGPRTAAKTSFLSRKSVCGGYPRPPMQNCDEYPYATTLQGGTINYDAGNVSVRLVSRSESNIQGRLIGASYSNSPIGIGDNFIVIPLGGQSGYFDKRWRWHDDF